MQIIMVAARRTVRESGTELLIVLAAVLVLATQIPVAAHAAFVTSGTTTRVNVHSSGQEANLDFPPYVYDYGAVASPDGRYVAFACAASNLVAGDTNNANDVFLRDRVKGSTVRVSVSDDGGESGGGSYADGVSADGKRVLFHSGWSGFVDGDTNGHDDLFIRDLESLTTTRVVMAADGGETNEGTYSADMSPNGRWIAFESAASNLVDTDLNGQRDVFVRDLESGTNTLVSVSTSGEQADASCGNAKVSIDGRYVVFVSEATNLVEGDTNGRRDVFIRDLQAKTTARVSVNSAGAQSTTGAGQDVGISASGRYSVFTSTTSLSSADTNSYEDVYVRDIKTGATVLASRGQGGVVGNEGSTGGSISRDGRYVAFVSGASNLVAGDTSETKKDVFVRDLPTGAIERVSVSPASAGADASSGRPLVGDGAKWILFESLATNLVAGDHNGKTDLFIRTWPEPVIQTALSLSGPSKAPAYNSPAKLTARLKKLNGTAIPDKLVIFETWNGSSWVSIGSPVKTNSTGYAYKYTGDLKTRKAYRARFATVAPYQASKSAYIYVYPKVKLTRTTSWTTLARSKTYYAKGYIAPKHSKSDPNKVKIRAYKKGSDDKYRLVKSFTASYSYYSKYKTRYRAAIKLSKGSWKLVAYHAKDGRNAKTYGAADYVRVR